jgi:hypothetical protein
MNRNLKSVAKLASSGPFSEGQLRWWIFNAEQNGLAASGAIVRVQRRIYVDVDAFERWIQAQNSGAQVAA